MFVGNQTWEGSAVAPIKPGDKMTGRYFQQTEQPGKAVAVHKPEAKTAASEAQAERDQALAALEQAVAKDPSNDELWVLLALHHIDFGAVDSLKGCKSWSTWRALLRWALPRSCNRIYHADCLSCRVNMVQVFKRHYGTSIKEALRLKCAWCACWLLWCL